MVWVMLLMVVLFIAVSTAAAATLSESGATLRQQAFTTARQTAVSGSSWVLAQLSANSSFLTSSTYRNIAGSWVTLDSGAPRACVGSVTSSCFSVTVTPKAEAGNGGVKELDVNVLARQGCLTGGGPCAYARAQATLRQANFFDYLAFDDYETLDPFLYPTKPGGSFPSAASDAAASACLSDSATLPTICQPVAYTSVDTVDGPVRTNSSVIYICGSPTFDGAVNTTGSQAVVPVPGEAACTSSSPVLGPGASLDAGSLPYQFPFGVSPLAKIASPVDTFTETGGQPVEIRLSGSSYSYSLDGGTTFTPAPDNWPVNGVIYVNGDASIEGNACSPVSIAATGSIFLPSNLTTDTGAGCSKAAVGIEANNAVVVTCYGTGATTASCQGMTPYNGTSGQVRTIDAAIIALGVCDAEPTGVPPSGCQAVSAQGADGGGSFYVASYDSAKWYAGARTGTAPVLQLNGAVAERWRGAYGAYGGSGAHPVLYTGYEKDFTYNQGLLTSQPPYFLRPVGTSWVQVGTPLVAPCATAGC